MTQIGLASSVIHQIEISKLQHILNSVNNDITENIFYKELSVNSINIKEMGIKAIDFITEDKSMQCYIPTKLIKRESL